MHPSIEATDKHSVVNGEKKKSGLIRKYGLNMSRQAFREKATDMGWVKVRMDVLVEDEGLTRSSTAEGCWEEGGKNG